MKITVDIETDIEREYFLRNILKHHCKLTEEQARKMLKEITWRWDGILFAATIERWKLKGFITEA